MSVTIRENLSMPTLLMMISQLLKQEEIKKVRRPLSKIPLEQPQISLLGKNHLLRQANRVARRG